MESKRLDHEIIYQLIEPDSKVLDLGCGQGDLLDLLVKRKNVKAQGIELKEEAIYNCVEKGLSVFHGDIDSGLSEYPDKTFDYVILNQTMQEAKNVEFVIDEALRVGKKVVVGFPNFAYIGSRLKLLLKGKSPITLSLPYFWYNTPNLHFLSVKDFKEFCIEKNIRVVKAFYLSKRKSLRLLPNLFALNALFVIENNNTSKGG